MIRMVQCVAADQAKSYFADALSKADYYINDQELQGRFQGKLVEPLGLETAVSKEAFYALCENLHPLTGKKLTERTKENRTVGYDINFHCPKSVSIIHALSKDTHILDAFQSAVKETMEDIEQDSQTRVRKNGKDEDRATGAMIWAEFVHQTARPVEGFLPDPHLHAHCFTFNVTWDEHEKKMKAAQFRDSKRDALYYQSRFHKRLSDKLAALGYAIRRTDTSFEVIGVPQPVIDLFSKRTDEIGRVAKEKGITNAKELDALGARTRAKKQKGLSMAELTAEWRKQIRTLDLDREESDKAVRHALGKDRTDISPKQCVDHALHHCFERASVMAERRILATAYRHSIGSRGTSLDGITEALQSNREVIQVKEGQRVMCTTRSVLAEEKHMVELAQAGRGKMRALYQQAPRLNLSGQQAAAVIHVLTTTDRVSIIRGAAGTGKTTLMQEAVRHITATGKRVTVVAPTAQASRGVLRKDGFKDAETVARLLCDVEMQKEVEGQIIWVDEAPLLGTKDMTALLQLATDKNARLLLGGDVFQHASVARGDAVRILHTVGGIKAAEVSKIFRQRPKDYREAVQDLSSGSIQDGFERLDNMGAIKTIDPLSPNTALVDDYVSALKRRKSALVISPTHQQGEAVTAAIRAKLRQIGVIGQKEITATKLVNSNLTEAEKEDWRNFRPGQVIQFNQNVKGFKRGSAWTVHKAEDGTVNIRDNSGKDARLPLSSRHYDVFNKTDIQLAKGDRVHITRNGFDQQKKRLDNGDSLEVLSVAAQGQIKLRNPSSKSVYILDQEFGHIAHAHCITSYASQGKTVDEVFISQPAATFSASDAKQFYVSVSRGRDAAHIYTDDKEALLATVSEVGNRTSALELLHNKQDKHLNHVVQRQRGKTVVPPDKTKQQDKTASIQHHPLDHEPRV
jgi:conjugative relaxase-like TrwC/TraI family protein